MIQPTLQQIALAVGVLGVLALSLALTVYLLMEIYHRRQIARNARRLILSSKLYPPLSGKALQELWSHSGRGDRELIEDILVDMCRTPDQRLRTVVERSIMEAGIVERWLQALQSSWAAVRVRAVVRLGFVHDARGVVELARIAADRSGEVQLAVILSLGRLRDPRGVPGLLRIVAQGAKGIPDLTLAAALAACVGKSPGRLAALLKAPDARQRVIGAWALSEVADDTVLQPLLAAAKDPEPEVRAKVARALARLPNPKSLQALHRLASDAIWFVRVRALDALGQLSAISEETIVLAGLQDKVREVRYRAAFALRRLGGMRGELVEKVLASLPRSSFETLMSEWDQAGFLWDVVSGLSTHDFEGFVESQNTLRMLIAAGVLRGLTHLILVFPDLKVRLRLLRLFLENPTPGARGELLGLSRQPKCDRRVAAAIGRAFPSPGERVAAGVEPSRV